MTSTDASNAVPFAGRVDDARALRASIDVALAGRGAGALVIGEAGIGKTRLVTEVVDAGLTSARSVWSAAWTGGAQSHWHWIQLLRGIAAGEDRSDLTEDLGDDEEELARLVPDLRSGMTLAPPAAVDGDDPRFRMYEAIASFLRRRARRRPLVLVLDDVHAADLGTLALLRFVAADTRQDPIAVVAMTRDPDVEDVAGDARDALVELHRLLEAIRLAGLSGADVERLVVHLVGAEQAGQPAKSIHSRSGGNPLFVGELARLMATGSSRETLPATIRAVIERRIATLSPRSVDMLHAAAVIGDAFTPQLVEQATGASRVEVLAAFDDGLRAQVLDPAKPMEFRFHHALLREVLYEQLPIAERARIHRVVGEALEASSPGDVAAAVLAHHFLAALPAVDDGKAVEYATRAGQRSVEQLAYDEAAAHFRAAVSALDVGADEDRWSELVLALGDAALRAGDIIAAREAFVEVAGRARRRGRADLIARAAIGLGSGLDGFEIRLFDHAQIELLDEALAGLGPAESELRSWLTARLSVALTFAAPSTRRLQLADEAVALARSTGADRALAYALAARSDATAGPDHIDDRRHAADDIIRLAQSVLDRGMELLGSRNLLIALLESGDIARFDGEVDRYTVVADAIRQPLYQWYVPLWRGMRALMDGRLEAARAFRDEAATVGVRAGSHNAALSADILGWNIDLKAGRWHDAAGGLARQLPLAGGIYAEPFWIGLITPQVHPVEAKATLDRFLADNFASFPRDAIWLASMTYLADACGIVDHVPAAEPLYELILPHRTRFAVDGIGAACYGSMSRPLGVLAGVLGREDAARQHFDDAIATHRACGAAALVAESLHDLGIALARFGDVKASVGALEEARSLYDSVGMTQRCAQVAAVAGQAAPPAPAGNVFRRDGDYWTLTYAGQTVRVADAKGLHDIAALLQRQGQEVHVADLIGMVHGAGGGAVIDTRARAEYRQRLFELRDELDDAEANGDIGRAEKARATMDLIASELAAAVGLAGRARTAGDPAERPRKAVTQRIRNAIKRLEDTHSALAAHLDRSISTGRFCSYRPERPVDWRL